MNDIVAKTDYDTAIFSALKNSLYPGAKDESIMMVLDYCKASGLDPMHKPVHIVPMYVTDVTTGQKGMRDVIMPGIGSYRIKASRTGQYAGKTEPIYGEKITAVLGGVEITYPEWCKITVKKIVNDTIVEFTAMEYWIENYATAGRDNAAPNAMWRKRPFAQLCKCVERQALTQAFSDTIGNAPVFEEMEGKSFDSAPSTISRTTNLSDKLIKINNSIKENTAKLMEASSEPISTSLETLYKHIVDYSISDEIITKWCDKAGVTSLEGLTEAQIESTIEFIKTKYDMVW